MRKTPRHRQSQKHRHAHHLQAGSGNFPGNGGIQGQHHRAAFARTGLFEFGPGNYFYRRAGSRRPKPETVLLQERHRGICQAAQQKQRAVASQADFLPQGDAARNWTTRKSKSTSRSCCNTTTVTTTRCFATPTRFTIPTAARISRGFRSAVTRAINQYAKSNELLKEKDPQITGDDVREGLDGGDFGEAQRSQIRIADQGEIAFARSGRHRRLGDLRRVDELISMRIRRSRSASWTKV